MSFGTYQEYRDSGADLLGAVPAHWTVCHLKRVARLTYGDALPSHVRDEGGEIEVFGSNGAVGLHDRSNTDAPVIFVGRKGSHGALNWSHKPSFAIDTVYFIDRRSCAGELRWLYWALHTLRLDTLSQDTGVPGLARETAHETLIPVPPDDEQVGIAAFLDRETAKIDALVEEQRRLIELLKEKRQAVISHAVTKGLDPSAPMKDSGVEWLGEVPAHWTVKRLKHLGDFEAGAGFPHEEQGVEGEELPFHKVNALSDADQDGFLTSGANTISRETAARLRANVFPTNAIVFAKIGAALLLGRVRLLRWPACLDNNMMGFTTRAPNEPAFVRHLFGLVRFDLIANPGTVPSLNEGQIANVSVSVPPPDEQSVIAMWLATETERLDRLSEAAARAVVLLQERRAALISAAVTGKIDVRSFSSNAEAA